MYRAIRIIFDKTSLCKLLILLALLNVTSQSFAQSKNEVSLYLQGAFSKLDYEVFNQKSDMENGFGIGASYAYYLSPNWSIGTGVELQYMKASLYLAQIDGAYTTQDSEGEDFEFRYTLEDISENQDVYFMNIPLQVQYETPGKIRFYAASGIKVGVVLKSEYETLYTSLMTSGYYPQYNVELTDPEFAGFGEFGPGESSKTDLGLKTNFIGHFESGLKLMLANEQSIYLGLFLDYGLNDIQPEISRAKLINYNPQDPTEFTIASVLSSLPDEGLSQDMGELKTLAYGLKVRYAFQF
ncbi:outer membrane protein with beta-barrel domain [Salegentibacter sp. 24]|uniref:outer membrane beta-barrel protein n=1 Tax=Salegentibacter sp. 24 TaxID=2183986 RepID=UPI00105B4191|nr:outer membrane beta-barrel protein [Salegentibacter sp. 24]TDN83869.1 outer membrane protein with beta-barrel domain [Salegentibacter sp. 24]